MPDMIDTSFPAWLAARNAPHQQSPWILQAMQQGMQREEMRQKLPLQLQEMALQNQANALAIHRQSILNDQADQNMLEYREQLPRFKEWYATTKGNPLVVASTFPQGISNPQLIKEVGDLQLAASRSLVVQTAKQNMIDDALLYREATKAGLRDLKLGQDGLLSQEDRNRAADAIKQFQLDLRSASHPDTVMRTAQDVADLKEKLRDSEAQSRGLLPGSPEAQGEFRKQLKLQDTLSNVESQSGGRRGKADVELVEYEGKKFLKNTVTGALHEVSKTVDRQQFIANHLTSYLRDLPSGDADEAAKQLGAIYDKHIAPSGTPQTAPASKTSPELRLGSVVQQGGKRYRYRGGPVNDPSSYVEVK